MKLILISAILSLGIYSASAQKLEIGVNGGFQYNSAVHRIDGAGTSNEDLRSVKAASTTSFKAMLHTGKWQYGLSIDYTRLNGIYKESMMFYCPVIQSAENPRRSYTNSSTPIIPLRLFLNRTTTFKNFEIYGGASAGYVFFANTDTYIPMPDVSRSHYSGYSTGVQTGATWYVTEHTGINLESHADYIHLTASQISSYAFSYPVTIGIRYRF